MVIQSGGGFLALSHMQNPQARRQNSASFGCAMGAERYSDASRDVGHDNLVSWEADLWRLSHPRSALRGVGAEKAMSVTCEPGH